MDMSSAPLEQALVRLSDGRMMPQLGLGTWQLGNDEAAGLVRDAIAAGYRAIDTAAAYGNEEGVGRGIAESGVPRDQIFVTTKLGNGDHGRDATLSACRESLERLGTEWIDLYLIHWPRPDQGLFVESWKAMIELQAQGVIRSVGVSNFQSNHLERIIDDTGVMPVLNQIELHPRFQQVELRAWMDENGIVAESWSPLGRAQILKDDTIVRIAAKHGRSPAQVVIRWHLDQGIVTIPKAADRAHMVDNLSVGGFTLDEEDRAAIDALDADDGRIGPHPDRFAG